MSSAGTTGAAHQRLIPALALLVCASALALMLAPGGHDRDHGVLHMQSATSGSAAARPATRLKPLSCEKLPHIPGKSVTTAIVEFPPLAYTPAHRHPGSVTAVVTKGEIRSQLDSGAIAIFRVGETWFEPPGTLHNFAENPSPTEPAEILAVFIADTDCGPLVILER